MQARAEFNDWNNCWPVSGPDSNRLLLWTLGPATFQPSRCACVSTRLHAGARRPNSPHMWRLAGVIVLCGETHILWQFPNLPRQATVKPARPLLGISHTFIRFLSCCWAASGSPDREPSRFATLRDQQGCPENHDVGQWLGPLRTGTVRGPIQSWMQPCSLCCRLGGRTAFRPWFAAPAGDPSVPQSRGEARKYCAFLWRRGPAKFQHSTSNIELRTSQAAAQ